VPLDDWVSPAFQADDHIPAPVAFVFLPRTFKQERHFAAMSNTVDNKQTDKQTDRQTNKQSNTLLTPQERYLAAMSAPEWARALIRAQEETAAEAEAAEARGTHSGVAGGAPAPDADSRPPPKFHGGSVLDYLRRDKQLKWFQVGSM
jgi:hypothetical protein